MKTCSICSKLSGNYIQLNEIFYCFKCFDDSKPNEPGERITTKDTFRFVIGSNAEELEQTTEKHSKVTQ